LTKQDEVFYGSVTINETIISIAASFEDKDGSYSTLIEFKGL
jgi:hypothetical protein